MARSEARVVSAQPDGALVLRNVGLGLGLAGLVVASVAFVNAVVGGNNLPNEADAAQVRELLAWGFGVGIAGFALGKLGIASVLAGILRAVRDRADAAEVSVPAIMRRPGARTSPGDLSALTPYGRVSSSELPPPPLTIHRVAARMWKPMLAMGAIAVAAGLALSLAQAGSEGSTARSLSAWAQGTLFLGEGFLLAGISFLLGSILGQLRAGGGRVQLAAGVTVRTPNMPTTAKAFLGLMMVGLMIEIGQFVAYAIVATSDSAASVAEAFAWLGPVREFGLGLLLSGIVLALATIAKILGFQFWRLGEIVSEGR
jgi:hypothetical protein